MSKFVNLLDIVYPVGSVYITFSNVSPVDSVGGTWSQITNKVLRAANDTTTGGVDVQSKNFDHNHYMSLWWNQSYNFATGNACTGINVHNGNCITANCHVLTSTSSQPVDGEKHPGHNGIWQEADKPLSTVTWSNLPAYQNCYVWRRTA